MVRVHSEWRAPHWSPETGRLVSEQKAQFHFYVETTLFDMIFNFRIPFDKLKAIRKVSNGTGIAKKYIGFSVSHTKGRTLMQTVDTRKVYYVCYQGDSWDVQLGVCRSLPL